MKHLAVFIAALAASTSMVSAACSPSISGITDGISIDVAGCHLQIQNPAIIPTHTLGGVEVIVRNPTTGEVGSDGGNITEELDRQIAVDADQDAKNTEQDGRLDANDTKNATQDGKLEGQKARIKVLEATDVTHTAQIGSLEETSAGHTDTLNAHSAMLSQHSAQIGAINGRLDEQAKGIAIATAMPDAWLSDKEQFAIAAGVGGFGDETALGVIAIGRIDETWSLNAGFGSDTEFKEFGWKAGVRAGW